MTRIGIALGADRLVARLPGSRQLESPDVADLRQAFGGLKKASGVSSAGVFIALLPPLVDLRRVTLPPLRVEDRRRVVERDAARYFVGVREAQVVGFEGPVAAAVSARLIEELEAAVAEVGWVLRAIMPAQVAWTVCLGDGHHAVRLPHATELLHISDGRIVERSRLRPGEAAPAMADMDPYAVAADCAPRARAVFDLSSVGRRAARHRATKRMAIGLSVAAVLCVLVAAGVEHWGLGRELATLRSRRAAIAPQVAAAMQLRDSIGSATTLAQTLATLEGTSPSWSSLFADLAEDLPRDAYVAVFEARSDSFTVTGVAREANGVLRGLERVTRVTRIRADGPIRQDVTPAGIVREHFRLAARLAQ